MGAFCAWVFRSGLKGDMKGLWKAAIRLGGRVSTASGTHDSMISAYLSPQAIYIPILTSWLICGLSIMSLVRFNLVLATGLRYLVCVKRGSQF